MNNKTKIKKKKIRYPSQKRAGGVAQGVARVQIPVQKNKTKNLDFI
jgi:hypothetical protein